ncbi:MAG TPA: ATP synthase F1 subunit delta [Dehalococcoidia bacterium]|nr:ATP synthase F1 subunit delta [Dehalococcoidia bacterium]
MSIAVSSKRYAQAVFQVAQEKDELEKWRDYLGEIAEIMQNAQYIDLLENPKVPFEEKLAPVKILLGQTEQEVLNFASLLVIKNKFKYAAQIAEHYGQLLDEYQGIKRSTVTTSIPLDNDEQNNLTQNLERIIGNKLKSDFEVNPDILGGFIARINGTLIDASIKNRLIQLKNNISKKL